MISQLLVKSSVSLQIKDQLARPILDSENWAHSFFPSCIQYAKIEWAESEKNFPKNDEQMTYDMIVCYIEPSAWNHRRIWLSVYFGKNSFVFV